MTTISEIAGASPSIATAPVATALPPRNRRNTGNVCPTTAAAPASASAPTPQRRAQHPHRVGAAGVAAALLAQIDAAQPARPVPEGAGAEQVADHDREHDAVHAGSRRMSRPAMKYSIPDQIVTATAHATSTVVTVCGGSSTISAMIAATCTVVLTLPQTDALITTSCVAAISRSPVTANSRAMITIATHAATRSSSTSEISAAEISSLSASGSSSFPTVVIDCRDRARYPSSESVAAATLNTTTAIRSPWLMLPSKATMNTGISMIRPSESQFGSDTAQA